MNEQRIPTYAEIASFKESLIKSRNELEQMELKSRQEKLARMEFACLRAIGSLAERSDRDLMLKAQQLATLKRTQHQKNFQRLMLIA